MTDQSTSLGSLFVSSENKRRKLDQLPSANTPEYQDLLEAAISEYTECLKVADRVSLFSPNETLDDVSTNDIQYFLISFYLAALYTRRSGGDRKEDLRQAQSWYMSFLKQLDSYDLLGKDNFTLLERFQEAPDKFSIVSSSDPAARRETKIRRFKEEKDLKQRLEYWKSKSASSQHDEIARHLYIQQNALAVHETFQALESIAQEFHILSLAPPPPPPSANATTLDSRDRTRGGDGYSDRLDGAGSHLSAGLKGPLLDSKGRPMRPFTLLDKRQQLQQGVFRPDHSLPTMTIDEYLEEERRRGGIIEGGGPQSGLRPEPDEDDIEKADAETLKARAWDDFKDENPRGAGNTLNRG
ncbi:type 2A phosphatase-associated protein 42 [Myriangium duriaei CBS 260.36]|uniref:Type 2A phosphatase-associated protein 42 n=1 Tax=Myriangium duriaei CBS 260.36 TaxID=1168546 RepID=A0A9P4J1A1_9PEZI|nr:type 2A phosphatase-associated protein 42 [Myriangium duriaei CBS 260.36]